MSLYLSRLTLNVDAPSRALIPLLNPSDKELAADSHHRLIWSLFSDSVTRTRDFLWRYDGGRRFFALSARPPRESDLFLPAETKLFEPKLKSGDQLKYVLRTNATRTRKQSDGSRLRVDVVMDRLHGIKTIERAAKRQKAAQEAADIWIRRQGERCGFRPLETLVEGYRTLDLKRRSRQSATLGILDLSGKIEVVDPAAYLPAMVQGFGRAKAWGCGLMLIRRVK